MSDTKINMPYGTGETVGCVGVMARLEKEMKYRECFVNAHCAYDCPNFQIDIANERYGYGIADDMGLEKVSCKDCRYHSGKCEDCLFEHSKECPEYSTKSESEEEQ